MEPLVFSCQSLKSWTRPDHGAIVWIPNASGIQVQRESPGYGRELKKKLVEAETKVEDACKAEGLAAENLDMVRKQVAENTSDTSSSAGDAPHLMLNEKSGQIAELVTSKFQQAGAATQGPQAAEVLRNLLQSTIREVVASPGTPSILQPGNAPGAFSDAIGIAPTQVDSTQRAPSQELPDAAGYGAQRTKHDQTAEPYKKMDTGKK